MSEKVSQRIEARDRSAAADLMKMSEEVRQDFSLSDTEDVVQCYKVINKSNNNSIKGKLFITQNYFCFRSQYGKKLYVKIQISSIKEMTNEIKIYDNEGRMYYFVPQSQEEECFNLMYYMYKYPFSVLDLNIYKQHTVDDHESNSQRKFDIETAQEALVTAEEMKKIKEENYKLLEQQQRKIAMIDQLLDKTDNYLGEIDDSIKATKSLVYELRLRYTKTKQVPPPKEEIPVLIEAIKETPPVPVEIQILWKLENDDLVPATMKIFDDHIDIVETTANKKKTLSRSFSIQDVLGLYMRARPLHLQIALNQSGKEKGRIRLCSTCLQFIVNEIYIRYLKIFNKQLSVTFEPNSQVFDYGDLMITKTFMNCSGIKGQIKFTEGEDMALRVLTGKDREDYLAMKKTNQKTVEILDSVAKLNVKTTKMADDSMNAVMDVTNRMNEQRQMIMERKKQCDEITKK
ncbi:hypothetical protein EHI8A_035720 [Entamoeba histolytica HM-1:IMSS-B]|uniref:GRAM domain-containing protein n=6 Tax=Entamoeba histolytica TaxID=5759 RepID=C4M792_ENTH1|nr:hypothetical protein EHI_044200 [Entamoeba histolytica HM-1:IMSS]EMD44628.1 Hypothetical protein EHI5A_012810 [Entamoeba histolytica KU27]EMH77174.1 hypothetical protein EHI8A_035720 [Entamoeba histolytica HM-1:IMSS-B]EMS17914.1 hypothetical protein KM1_016090 [Entamoeba histolytica HM-3:IMSS]ENY64916.1 hypothetical protein EHI7A_005460 [Entamoeba histolytica HM-1:IMSS-A]GAT97385.1 hypothetical protein CL6EHI_044200 [Entamoeba histolytica]|eukprot:XP_652374.1 hypothetical protein EHI_044200 [Entamoeba histolytica HM-1:IMSS]